MNTILKQVIATTLEVYNSRKELAVTNMKYLNNVFDIKTIYQIDAFFKREDELFIVHNEKIYKIVADVDLFKSIKVLEKKPEVVRIDRDIANDMNLDKSHYFYYAVKVEE